MNKRAAVITAAALALMVVVPSIPAHADSASCQRAIAKHLLKFSKMHLKAHVKCLRKQNLEKISGPCPDLTAQQKIQTAADKATLGISTLCTSADLTALNYPTDCNYMVATSGVEADCAALPVGTNPSSLSECLQCWKAAEQAEYLAILYSSHANEICGGNLSSSSPVCAPIDCTTPLPDQRNLTGGEGDCQHGIGLGGWKYLFKSQKLFEKCALAGGTLATCAADLELQAKLSKYEQTMRTKIQSKCGNRDPAPSPPFCCRTGMGNACVAAADRDDCENVQMGDVQEDKICNAGNCDPTPGNKKITWWDNCPENATCPGPALTVLDDLKDCVGSTANAVRDELMCLQFRGNSGLDWPCPAD